MGLSTKSKGYYWNIYDLFNDAGSISEYLVYIVECE
jgi:hypothetical protein